MRQSRPETAAPLFVSAPSQKQQDLHRYGSGSGGDRGGALMARLQEMVRLYYRLVL